MLNTLRMDAAAAMLDSFNVYFNGIDTNSAFGKNGVIQYVKKLFEKVGIDVDGIDAISQLEEGLEATFEGDDDAYEEAIKKLINILKK